MQKRYLNNVSFVPSVIILILIGMSVQFNSCRNSARGIDKNQPVNKANPIAGTDDYPSFVNFRTYQNPDSSWGFTIFVNSKPFRSYKKIPFDGASSGFVSKKDAEIIARLFTRMISDGDLSPKLSKKILDTIAIAIKIRR